MPDIVDTKLAAAERLRLDLEKQIRDVDKILTDLRRTAAVLESARGQFDENIKFLKKKGIVTSMFSYLDTLRKRRAADLQVAATRGDTAVFERGRKRMEIELANVLKQIEQLKQVAQNTNVLPFERKPK